jgi:adenine-specific DNA-methyltransferase
MSIKPYYGPHAGITIYHGDCREILPTLPHHLVVTDPPYNVGYHYEGYDDNLEADEYAALIKASCRLPSVVIHYPEDMCAVSWYLRTVPVKMAAWVYNSMNPRQHRSIAWFGIKPDFEQDGQEFKNPTDRRISAKIDAGKMARLYDWWEMDQVKNVSEEKTAHPCQIPLELMKRILKLTPCTAVIDPFCGSGTTLVAAQSLGLQAIGIEINQAYCDIAINSLRQQPLPFTEPLSGCKIETQGELYGASTDSGNKSKNIGGE